MLITDIKSEQHCSVCHVSSKERKNLKKKWSLRTHEFTQKQIQRQRLRVVNSKDDDWIHDMTNFVWNHHFVNIHETIMMNILHQLFKRMIMHFLTWIQFILKIEMFASRRRREQTIRSMNLSELDKLDARFRDVFVFIDLKTFFRFFEIKQWTDEEQKTIVRQIISVIISLMINKWSHAVNFIRALVDFILIAQYRSHDDSILRYLHHALYRINFFKEIFRQSRSIVQKIEKDHFNFSKFHAFSHYADFIRRYDAVDEYDTSHDEIKHKYMIKKFYDRINKRETFQAQLIEHNKRRLNILAMKDIMRHAQKRNTNKDINFTHTRSSRDSLNLKLLRITSTSNNRYQRMNSSQSSIHWCLIQELNEKIQISDLIAALTVFVRENRLKRNEKSSDSRDNYRRESDSQWILNYEVCLHDSIICWVRTKHNFLDMNELVEEKMRCKSRWQNRIDIWRRDYVWIQKDFSNQTYSSISFENRSIEQILCIIIIKNTKFRDEKNRSLTYCDVLLNVKRSRHKRVSNEISEMIELKNWRDEIARNSKNLRANRMYNISSVIRSVHVVFSETEHYYVNNYVNWDTYNTVYDENFLKNEVRRAEEYKKSCQ
jgi:hypothetical protein